MSGVTEDIMVTIDEFSERTNQDINDCLKYLESNNLPLNNKKALYSIGFLYEFGFNASFYWTFSRMKYVNIKNAPKSFLEKYLLRNEFKRSTILSSICENVKLDESFREVFESVASKAFAIGYLQGQSCCNNFFATLGGVSEVLYYQANFANPINVVKLEKDESVFQKRLIDLFFNKEISDEEYHSFLGKGEFLKADSILMVKNKVGGKEKVHVLVIDNKFDISFLLAADNKFGDSNSIKKAYEKLYLRKSSKPNFTNLSIDTGVLDVNINESMVNYANSVEDKLILKVIQAGSYAQSFLYYLKSNNLFKDIGSVCVHSAGISDTGYSIVKLFVKDIYSDDMMYSLKSSYKALNRQASDDEKSKCLRKSIDKFISNFRQTSNVKFNDLMKLLEINDGATHSGIQKISISETLKDYTNTAEKKDNVSFRERHGQEIAGYLDGDVDGDIDTLFLVGNPGVGKTYTIREYVSNKDNFLMIYVSPRNAVNDDMVNKFIDKDSQKPMLKRMVLLSADSTDEKMIDGKKVRVVNYIAGDDVTLPQKTQITFLDKYRKKTHEEDVEKFDVLEAENIVVLKSDSEDGVFSRAFEAVRDCIWFSDDIDKILVTLSIQGQKTINKKEKTIKALKKIFGKVVRYNELYQDYNIDKVEFERFAKRCPNIVVMIDEVTGSSEGVSLYHSVKEILIDKFYKLLSKEQQEKINIKIVVADASINNSNVIDRHFDKKRQYEQDKVYVSEIEETISKDIFTDDSQFGKVINANSYPAAKLNLEYNCYINIKDKLTEYQEDECARRYINAEVAKNMVNDIMQNNFSQTIAFVQDKQRLDEIIINVKNMSLASGLGELEEERDYVIITADLNNRKRDAVVKAVNNNKNKDLNTIKFVFVTSSASRGLSFEPARSVHVILNKHNIESFLMELCQVIYRPRGNSEYDLEWDKYLRFYYPVTICYTSREINSFECKKNLSIINTLSYITLLRCSILTRIEGYSNLADKKVQIIPVGGKNVTNISKSMIDVVCSLIKELNAEIRGSNNKKYINFLTSLKDTIKEYFNSGEVFISNSISSLPLNKIYKNFLNNWGVGMNTLLAQRYFNDVQLINGLVVGRLDENVVDDVTLDLKKESIREKLIQMLVRYSYFGDSKDTGKKFAAMTIGLLKKVDGQKTHLYREYHNNQNRYVAIPIYSLLYDNIGYECVYENIDENGKDERKQEYKQTLTNLMRNYTNCYEIGPITSNYEIPFITFKADSLKGLTDNMFDENYLIVSTETNIFSLLLS